MSSIRGLLLNPVADNHTATTIQSSWSYAAGGTVLCICTRLEWVTSLRSGVTSKPHRTLVEIVLCFVPPLVGILNRTFILLS